MTSFSFDTFNNSKREDFERDRETERKRISHISTLTTVYDHRFILLSQQYTVHQKVKTPFI